MGRTSDSVALLRRLALLGAVGGLLFCIGDQLLFLTPGFDMTNYGRPDWPVMPMWRFAVSSYLGVAGMPLLVAGTYSLYRAVEETCPRWAAGLALFGVFGEAMSAFCHFLIGAFEPMCFKAMLAAGATEAQFDAFISALLPWLAPINVVAVTGICAGFACCIYAAFTHRMHARPSMVVVLVVGVAVVGLVLDFICSAFFGITGVIGGGESLGEGCVCLFAWNHWRQVERELARA